MVNGPCGVGKSTVSGLIAERSPDSLLIPVGSFREIMAPMLFDDPNGRSEAEIRMWEANRFGRSLARVALSEDRDVIVDSVKYQTKWVEPWESLGDEFKAEVLDICLLAPKHVVGERARKRGYKPGGRLTPEKVSMLYDKVIMFYMDRPDALFLDSQDLSLSEMANEVINYDICDEDVDPVFTEGRNLYDSLLQEVIAAQLQ